MSKEQNAGAKNSSNLDIQCERILFPASESWPMRIRKAGGLPWLKRPSPTHLPCDDRYLEKALQGCMKKNTILWTILWSGCTHTQILRNGWDFWRCQKKPFRYFVCPKVIKLNSFFYFGTVRVIFIIQHSEVSKGADIAIVIKSGIVLLIHVTFSIPVCTRFNIYS